MTERYPDRRRYSAVVALCLWAALLVVGALFPGARLWGVHLIAFLSPAMKISVGLLFALACVYTFNPGGIADRLASITRRLGRGWWRGLLLVVMVGGGGWLLRAREALLGDGTLRANDAMIGSGWYPSELIPTALATWLTRGLPEAWGIDGYSAVGLVSIVGGVVFAAGLWWLVPRAARNGGRGAIFFILTCGAVRLFAGYVESYALGFALFAFWMLAMIAWLRGRVHWRVFVAFWVLAQLCHVTALALVPATLYVLWHKKERVGLAVFAVCVLTVGGTVLYFFRQLQVSALGVGESQFLVPFLPQPPHAYGIVSPAHWLDIVNHLFLLTPALAVAVLAALFSRRREQSTDVTVGHLHDSRIFYALAVALPLCAAFLIDPKLGWARDWDLFALLSAPALVAAALWLSAQAGALRRVAAATAVVSCVLWLTFSVDGRAERDRFEVLLDMDPSRSDYGHEIMGQYYRRQQNPEKVIEHYQKALLVSENARYRLNIAAAHMELGEYVEAERWYLGVAGRDSTIGPA
ncbi:MAG TPA: hypothetical protein VLB27_01625, partial [candidate division Zixibacteria bacterium]|nr:hypothetical protein [candidate division Zixibacteria bacterium]